MNALVDFDSSEWLGGLNRLLASAPRAARPIGRSSLLVDIRNSPEGQPSQLEFVVRQGVPQIGIASGTASSYDASAVLDWEVLVSLVVDADVPGVLAAWERGEVEWSGDRSTLLFHLYSLYPGGSAGGKTFAARVRRGFGSASAGEPTAR